MNSAQTRLPVVRFSLAPFFRTRALDSNSSSLIVSFTDSLNASSIRSSLVNS